MEQYGMNIPGQHSRLCSLQPCGFFLFGFSNMPKILPTAVVKAGLLASAREKSIEDTPRAQAQAWKWQK